MAACSSKTDHSKTDLTAEFIEQVFAECDTSGGGFINIRKLKIVMRALGLEPRQTEVDMLTRRMLENTVARSVNKEAFTAEELIYLLSDRFKEAEDTDEIQSAFKLFDTEGKGFITVNDLRRISNELGENLGEDELKEMINIADPSKKGRVSSSDFKTVMKKISLY